MMYKTYIFSNQSFDFSVICENLFNYFAFWDPTWPEYKKKKKRLY